MIQKAREAREAKVQIRSVFVNMILKKRGIQKIMKMMMIIKRMKKNMNLIFNFLKTGGNI
jgi:hypothetical protein